VVNRQEQMQKAWMLVGGWCAAAVVSELDQAIFRIVQDAASTADVCPRLHVPLQTFKPHKEQHGLTKAVSPELMTKRRALLVGLTLLSAVIGDSFCPYLHHAAVFPRL
jgi:hypothetical protein